MMMMIMTMIISLLLLLIMVVGRFLAHDEVGVCRASLVCPDQPEWRDC